MTLADRILEYLCWERSRAAEFWPTLNIENVSSTVEFAGMANNPQEKT